MIYNMYSNVIDDFINYHYTTINHLKLVDNVWSSLSARLKREAAEDTSSLDEEDCDGLFVDIGVGIAGLEEELDSLLSDESKNRIKKELKKL